MFEALALAVAEVKFDLPPQEDSPTVESQGPHFENLIPPPERMPWGESREKWEAGIKQRDRIMLGLHIADAATTIYCVEAIPHRCSEANPLYGSPHPSVGKILLIKSLDYSTDRLITAGVKKIAPRHVDVWQWARITVLSAIIANNVSVILEF